MKIALLLIASLLAGSEVCSQIAVEGFAGNQKTTADILFFKYFKNKEGNNSTFLFFNRNRASMDYRQTSNAYLPQFGFTEAVSYNRPALKGFAPVAVVQIFNTGTFPKIGVQYFHQKKHFMFFTWAVIETMQKPLVDYFVLTRFQPQVSEKVQLFLQLELVNTLPTTAENNYNFIQRMRLGLRLGESWQTGVGADFTQNGRTDFVTTSNIGVFLRKEF
ncbi:MAG: hypothetical protein ACKOC0_14610 [Cytophagales bacterium]